MGVIFEAPDVVAEHLVPFARERGCGLAATTIRELYKRCSTGELAVEQLWQQLGVRQPQGATQAYCELHRLTPGALEFLRWSREQGIPLACLSNDVAAWSLSLRERHGLVPLIAYWVISGDVGSRKPDTAMFEALRRASGVPFDACVFVDDRRANLDAAAALGMTPVAFGTVEAGLPHVEGFGDLTRLVAQLFDLPRS